MLYFFIGLIVGIILALVAMASDSHVKKKEDELPNIDFLIDAWDEEKFYDKLQKKYSIQPSDTVYSPVLRKEVIYWGNAGYRGHHNIEDESGIWELTDHNLILVKKGEGKQ